MWSVWADGYEPIETGLTETEARQRVRKEIEENGPLAGGIYCENDDTGDQLCWNKHTQKWDVL